jgi:hypothetical protein
MSKQKTNHEEAPAINEQELVAYIAGKTNEDPIGIRQVLKHERAFINNAKEDAKGEINVDIDELVDYIMARGDVKLSEPSVEAILESEMDFYMEKGEASYIED